MRIHADQAEDGSPASAASWPTAVYRHALVAGFDRAFLVAAALSVLILVATVTMIRGPGYPIP